MMKRITSMVLVFAMMASLLVTTATAASVLTLTITADKATATHGEEITFTVSVNAEDAAAYGGIQFALNIPEGLTYVPNSGKVDEAFKDDSGAFSVSFTEATLITIAAAENGFSNLSNLKLITFKCKVNDDAAVGNLNVSLDIGEDDITDTSFDAAPYTVVPAPLALVKTPMASASASVDAPVKGEALDTSVTIPSGAGYTATVTWYDGDTVVTGDAGINKQYTAKIVLTPKAGESFADAESVEVTLNGELVASDDTTVTISKEGDKLVITKTFDKTAKGDLNGTPTISGEKKVGQTLTANVTALNETNHIDYQWYSDGTLIAGATGKTYVLTPNELGKKVSVKVTAKEASHYAGTVASAETSAVAKGDQVAPTLTNSDITSVTSTTITVTANSDWEYSKDGGSTWQDSNEFAGLTPGAKYEICVRLKGNDAYNASPASDKVEVDTNKATLTLGVTIAGWTYGDEPNAPVVTGAPDGAVAHIEYKVKGAADSTYSTTVPSAAGDYTVKATVRGTNTYNAATATADFTIAKAAIAPSVSIDDWTYGETAKKPEVDGNIEKGTVTYTYAVKGSDSFSSTVPTNAGEYTVKATVGETANYQSGTATDDFTIAKADITPGVTLDDWTYGQTAKTPAVTGNTGNGTVTYTYKVKGANDSTYSATVPTTAGEYTVKATVAESANYKAGTATDDFEIIKAANPIEGTISAVTVKSETDLSKVFSHKENGTLTYGISDDNTDSKITDTTLTAGEKAGKFTLTVTAAESDNYKAQTKTFEVTVSNKQIQTITASDVTVTYGDTNKAVSATTTAGGGAISYAVTEGTCVEVNATTGALTINGAGTAKITVTAEENDTFAKATKVITVTIAKAKLEVKAVSETIEVDDTVPTPTYTVSGLKNNDVFERLGVTVTVAYVDANGNAVTPDNTKEGEYDIKVTGDKDETDNYTITYVDGKLTITEEEQNGPVPNPPAHDCAIIKFNDCDPYQWYHEGIDYAVNNGLMNGVGTGKFAPNANTTRAMIVTILWRLEGEPAGADAGFADVADGQWYSEAIDWAAANGIVTGYSATKFGPMDSITREQMAAILYRYADYKGYDLSAGENTNILSYVDAMSISEYAVSAMQWAVGEGLINGVGEGTLNPKGTATRAQVATILMRFCENVAK